MTGVVREWLRDPAGRSLDIDGVDASVVHRRAVERKPMLRGLFERFYADCRECDERYFGQASGRRLEIGSGAGIMRRLYPDVVTSDVKPLPFVDVVLRGEALPFGDGTLKAIYAINVFHHLAEPRRFFHEALRVLQPGGGVVLVEPFHGVAARWLFPRLHASEGFDVTADRWESDGGPMSRANQALSYVVFTRDRSTLAREFPALEVLADRPHTHLWYVASGGVNFRQLLPTAFLPLIRFVERASAPLNAWLALQHTIVLRKRAADDGATGTA